MKPLDAQIQVFGLHPTRRTFLIFLALLAVLSGGVSRVVGTESSSHTQLMFRFLLGCSITISGFLILYFFMIYPRKVFTTHGIKFSEVTLKALRRLQCGALFMWPLIVMVPLVFGQSLDTRPYLPFIAQLVLAVFGGLLCLLVKIDSNPPLGPDQLDISEENQLLFSLTKPRTEFIASVNQLIRENKPYTAMQTLMSDNQKSWEDNVQLLYLIARQTP